MKEIYLDEIKESVCNALDKACHDLNDYTLSCIKTSQTKEKDLLAKEILDNILENAKIAKNEHTPMCQDTGIVTCFAYVGREVHLNCDLEEAINEGVREAYQKFYLRKSVSDALSRINTKDNTPAIVHTKIVEGDSLRLVLAPKGAGSENMSKLKMLNPTDGISGIKEFVLQTIKEAGGRPCPPLFLGIGIGGNFETCALMAKEALTRSEPSRDENIKKLEEEIKELCNQTFIGPMGLGGDTTVFNVFINTCPCHIASLPVAINIQCHANRHEEVVL